MKRGFSLLEILIAFSILVFSVLGMIQVFRQGGTKGEAFSSEHFTAMFLAQKILEDINNRVIENPHLYTELTHLGTAPSKRIVDGESPYFKLLANTRNFEFLDESDDRPITTNSGALYRQLKNFKAQVETQPVTNPSTSEFFTNLIEVIVTITWTESSGKEQKYTINQYLNGFNEDEYAHTTLSTFAPFSVSQIGLGLWQGVASTSAPANPTLANFITFNGGGDNDAVSGIGSLLYLCLRADYVSSVMNEEIANSETQRDTCLASVDPKEKSKAVDYQLQVASLFEQRAALLFSLFVRFLPSLSTLQAKSLTTISLGNQLSANTNLLKAYCSKAILHLEKVSFCYAASEDAYQKLFQDPYRTYLPLRKVTQILRRKLDVEKMGIFFGTISGTNAPPELSQFQGNLNSLISVFKGKQPMFVEFLNREKEIARTFPDLQTRYGGVNGFAGVIEKVMNAKSGLETVAAKLP